MEIVLFQKYHFRGMLHERLLQKIRKCYYKKHETEYTNYTEISERGQILHRCQERCSGKLSIHVQVMIEYASLFVHFSMRRVGVSGEHFEKHRNRESSLRCRLFLLDKLSQYIPPSFEYLIFDNLISSFMSKIGYLSKSESMIISRKFPDFDSVVTVSLVTFFIAWLILEIPVCHHEDPILFEVFFYI